jgi:hypothetical protein
LKERFNEKDEEIHQNFLDLQRSDERKAPPPPLFLSQPFRGFSSTTLGGIRKGPRKKEFFSMEELREGTKVSVVNRELALL